MKKITFSITMFLMMSFCAMAQNPIYDASRQYDIVTDADTFYLFSTPKPCIIPERYTGSPCSILIKKCVSPDTVTVYGVAITFDNYNHVPYYDNNTNIKVLLKTFDSIVGGNHLGYNYKMHSVDTVTLNRSHPRFCWFNYEDDCDDNKTLLTPCYEFYFDTPEQINRMAGVFFVGFQWTPHISGFRPHEYGGRYSNSLPGTLYFCCPEYVGDSMFCLMTGSHEKLWGVAFPIIGFRCGSINDYWLDSYTGDSAVVSWRNTELGTQYNVRLLGSDGSDTTYTTSDTTITFAGLSGNVSYNVMLRKQCHYATANYDTTVHGEWLSYLSFGAALYQLTVLSNNPEWGTVDGGGNYDLMTQVGIRATPNTGYRFVEWNDGLTENPRMVTIVSDTQFVAHFAPIEGVEEALSQEEFQVVPNPANGQVEITSSHLVTRIEAYDEGGKQMLDREVFDPTVTFDVTAWPAGTYLLRITTPMGTVTKKLLVR